LYVEIIVIDEERWKKDGRKIDDERKKMRTT
jgi:hypothetical protein